MEITAPGYEPRSLKAVRIAAPANRTLFVAASFLFLAPNLLVALHFTALAGGLILIGALASAAIVATCPKASQTRLFDAPVDARRLLVCCLFAGAVFILGGEGHLFYANSDWLIRDAVLADLVRAQGLPHYQGPGAALVMRAPLGMYLLPAAFGKLFGLMAAHLALWLQNTLLLGAIFYFLASLGRGLRMLPIMFLFAGLCALARVILVWNTHRSDLLFTDIVPLDQWCPALQYSSAVTQFFWVPNHALPGWWIAVLLLLFQRQEIDLAVLGVSGAILALWSPLAIITLPVLALIVAAPRFFHHLKAARTWIGALAAALLVPIAAYLVLGADTIQHNQRAGMSGYWFIYLLFVTVQLPCAALVMVERRRVPKEWRGLLIGSVALLLALPMFTFGPGNDLVMRGSIPALVIIAFCFADMMIGLPAQAKGVRIAGFALLAIGSLSTVVEVARLFDKPAFPISRCTVLEASREIAPKALPSNYVVAAAAAPKWMLRPATALLADVNRGGCWPGLVKAPRDIDWWRQLKTPSSPPSSPPS